MDLKDISFKMFKANINEYKAFILCNISAIAILFSFLAIVTNEEFMNPKNVDPMISGNCYGTTVIIIIFNTLFLPYAQNIFIKSRQKDYGILLSLGLSESEMISSVFIEEFIISMVSIIIGLIFGTVLNLFFISFAKYIIGIEEMNICFSIKAYEIIFIYVFAIYIISLMISTFKILTTTVTEKLKANVKVEEGKHYSVWLIYLGIALYISAVYLRITVYKSSDYRFEICLILTIISSVLIFFNGEALIDYFKKKHYKEYIKNIFFISDIKYYYGKNKKTLVAASWIFFTIMFFIMVGGVCNPNLKKDHLSYNPFDITCVEFKDKFEPIDLNELQKICNLENNSVESFTKVNLIRNGGFTFFCVDDVNKVLSKDLKVDKGSYIFVYPYDIGDGNRYPGIGDNGVKSININSDDGSVKFTMNEYISDPLFGEVHGVSDYVLLVSKEDFDWIGSKCREEYNMHGTVNLYNLKDWKSSENIVEKFEQKSYEKNNIDKNDTFYSVSSKVKAYKTRLKSSNLIIFAIIYISVFLYSTVLIMINFKLKMEYEEEEKKYRSLYRIGIKNSEIKNIISKKVFMLFVVPAIYSIIISVICIFYSVPTKMNVQVIVGIIIAIIFYILNYIFYKIYCNRYYKKFIFKTKFLVDND